MKHKKWNRWMVAVFLLVSASSYGMYRLNQEMYELQIEQVEKGESEVCVIETCSELFLDDRGVFEGSETAQTVQSQQKQDGQANEQVNGKVDKQVAEQVDGQVQEVQGIQQIQQAQQTKEHEDENVSEIFVYVCGEVKNPDVYSLPQGSRVIDAITAAGGFSEHAAKEYWNLAELLEDGLKIAIPSIEEVTEDPYGFEQKKIGESTTDKAVLVGGLINLNQADAELLQTLPGIGEAKAEDIIQYRETHGDFSSIEEIMEISGIKETVFEKIKDKITV